MAAIVTQLGDESIVELPVDLSGAPVNNGSF